MTSEFSIGSDLMESGEQAPEWEMRSQLQRLSSLDLEIKPHQGRAKSAGKACKRTSIKAIKQQVERCIWTRVGAGDADRGRGKQRHWKTLIKLNWHRLKCL